MRLLRLLRLLCDASGTLALARALPTLKELVQALCSPNITLQSLNRLLYRCEPEEKDDSYGVRGVYGVPE